MTILVEYSNSKKKVVIFSLSVFFEHHNLCGSVQSDLLFWGKEFDPVQSSRGFVSPP